jgi:hypothetical protein
MSKDSLREWAKIRQDLKAIRDRNQDSEDPDLKNIATVIDMLLLTTYMPEHLHLLYDIVDVYLMEILGGKN